MNIDADPKQLANWLSIAMTQRQRAANTMARQYGENSIVVSHIQAEATELATLVNACMKLAAKQPLK